MRELKISTITATAEIGTPVHLPRVFEDIALCEERPGIVSVEFAPSSVGAPISRGSYTRLRPARRKKRTALSKGRFTNQVTIIVAMPSGYFMNCKLFGNGKVQLTGARSHEDGLAAVEKIAVEAASCGACVNTLDLCVEKYMVRLINSDFHVGFTINNRRLQQLIVKRYPHMCIYEPCIYNGVKLLYYHNSTNRIPGVCSCTGRCDGKGDGACCKKVTVAVFQTGSVIITGATDVAQVHCAYDFIKELLKSNRADI
jgi:hypothetical protein